MDRVKIILVVLATLAILTTGLWVFWLKQQVAFAQLATAYSAKQICSCRFVSERPMASCLDDFTDDISALQISEEAQTIRSKAPLGLSRNAARFSADTGCVLVRP